MKYTEDQVTTALDVLGATEPGESIDFAARSAALAVMVDYLQPCPQMLSAEAKDRAILCSFLEILSATMMCEEFSETPDERREDLEPAAMAVLHFGLGKPLQSGESVCGDVIEHLVDYCRDVIEKINAEESALMPEYQIPLWLERQAALQRLLDRCAGENRIGQREMAAA